ncbi:unnamed protein product [Prunus armeniaca]|uniref:Uncharacterized protein n=1 Tax=Prunus armeniaca TaxID=36596 RepID=A0A6J5W2V5_PRUAR|nr:unnamed protein product [Prunus armeniaca]CAB4294322.1 unnamed protein product [Prunus armeniaca]
MVVVVRLGGAGGLARYVVAGDYGDGSIRWWSDGCGIGVMVVCLMFRACVFDGGGGIQRDSVYKTAP